MFGDLPRRNQHCVESKVAFAEFWTARNPELRRGDDTALAALGDRLGGAIERRTRFHLDECYGVEAPRDDVDLADRGAKAPRQDAIAFGDEKRRGASTP